MSENCGRCGAVYATPPALSRVDNSTEVCPWCGIAEALYGFYQPNEKMPALTEEIPMPNKNLQYPLPTAEQALISSQEREIVDRVFTFAVILREADLMPPDEDEYFERPWKWDREYQAWVRAGRPQPPEGTTDLSWERFVRSATQEEA